MELLKICVERNKEIWKSSSTLQDIEHSVCEDDNEKSLVHFRCIFTSRSGCYLSWW